MSDIGLIITLYSLAIVCIAAIVFIWKKVEKDWKWPVIFVIACACCACIFLPINIFKNMHDSKQVVAEEPIDTLQLINNIKERIGYENID